VGRRVDVVGLVVLGLWVELAGALVDVGVDARPVGGDRVEGGGIGRRTCADAVGLLGLLVGGVRLGDGALEALERGAARRRSGDDEDASDAAHLAGAVGLRNLGGYLAGGMTSWREDDLDVERVARMTVLDLHDRWQRDRDGLQILDVRERDEWDAGHIPGSVHERYHDIRAIPAGLDPARPLAVICGSGPRAAVAAGLLQRCGARHAIHVIEGGVPRWTREGWPTATPGTD
jgi:rhodanese-related sulfurtransferase